MSTKNTDLITNFESFDTSPAGRIEGRQRTINGTVAVLTTDMEDDDIVMLAPIPTCARITSIVVFSDALAASGLAVDVGLYQTDGTVVDRDAYASAITTFQAGSTTGVEVAFEARDINKMGQRVWEDAAATSDPGGHYYLALTVETVGGTPADGDISFRIEYEIN